VFFFPSPLHRTPHVRSFPPIVCNCFFPLFSFLVFFHLPLGCVAMCDLLDRFPFPNYPHEQGAPFLFLWFFIPSPPNPAFFLWGLVRHFFGVLRGIVWYFSKLASSFWTFFFFLVDRPFVGTIFFPSPPLGPSPPPHMQGWVVFGCGLSTIPMHVVSRTILLFSPLRWGYVVRPNRNFCWGLGEFYSFPLSVRIVVS